MVSQPLIARLTLTERLLLASAPVTGRDGAQRKASLAASRRPGPEQSAGRGLTHTAGQPAPHGSRRLGAQPRPRPRGQLVGWAPCRVAPLFPETQAFRIPSVDQHLGPKRGLAMKDDRGHPERDPQCAERGSNVTQLPGDHGAQMAPLQMCVPGGHGSQPAVQALGAQMVPVGGKGRL